MTVFRLPLPPSTNALYANVTGKGRVKTLRYREWIREAGWEMKQQCAPLPFFAGPVKLEIRFSQDVALDLDNCKALPDLCKSMHVIADDRQVRRLLVDAWATTVDSGWCELELTPMETPR